MRVLVYPIKLKSHRDKFKLFLGGDFHSGDANYDDHAAQRFIDTVLESKKHDITRSALMGDYIAEFPKGDKRSDIRIQKTRIDPLAIYTDFRDFIRPISNTVVTCLTGNHDEDWWFENNIDYVNWMCAELNIPYGTYESYVRFKVSVDGESGCRRNIDFLLWHGAGGSKTPGGAFNKVRGTIESFRKPDLVAMGHLHRLGMLHEQWLDIDEVQKDVISMDQYFVLTGGYQKGYNPKSEPPTSSYISKKMLPPVAIGGVELTIQPFKHIGTKDLLDVQFSEVR